MSSLKKFNYEHLNSVFDTNFKSILTLFYSYELLFIDFLISQNHVITKRKTSKWGLASILWPILWSEVNGKTFLALTYLRIDQFFTLTSTRAFLWSDLSKLLILNYQNISCILVQVLNTLCVSEVVSRVKMRSCLGTRILD